MAKSGIEQLMEVLRSTGAFDDGGASSGGADSVKDGGRGGSKNVPHFDLSFFDDIKRPSSKRGWIIFIIFALLVIAALYWWFHPPISLNSGSLWMAIVIICAVCFLFFWYKRSAYTKGMGKYERSPKKVRRFSVLAAIPVAIVAVCIIGAFMSNPIFPGNAEKYSSVLQTDTLDFAEDIQEVNYSEIPVIDRNSAILLGNREMGTIPEYVSQFEVSELYSQINYKGEPVRVSPLGYADIFKWFTNRTTGIPAFSLVNMTTQDAEIVRLEGDSAIFYSQSEPLARNIERHVQLTHPFYIFDEISFEIDEEGHPWWICPVRTFTIGLFGGYTIDRVILCDATTGACTELAVTDVPQWVDRVFPAELIIQQYNWYGAYHNGWLNAFLGQEGVVRTTPGTDGSLGYNYIAKDDDVWVYTGVTSATADNSIVGFVLVNQRTQESHFYSVAGATEDSAMASAEGQVQNLRYTATFPLLINVSDQPTYFMALKDGAGLVKKFAMVDIQRYQNVAVGDTVAETQTAYETLLARNGVLTDAAEITDMETASGIISAMAQAVLDGNSHFYVTIEGSNGLFDFALPGMLEILKYKVGDQISFTYLNTEGTYTVYSILGPDGKPIATASGESNAAAQAIDASA